MVLYYAEMGRRCCPRILISRAFSSDIWGRVSGEHRFQLGGVPMKHLIFAAVVAAALMSAMPAFASPLNEQGITREEMVEVMLADGLPAKIDKDSRGNVIVRSRVSDINFDVYFFDCTDNRCGAIQFAAGWSNSTASEARINEWNTTKRYLRVYSKPGKVIWAEQDVLVTRSTTENLDDCLALWPKMIAQFKTFMKL
jgi:hypothetical protein